MPASYVKVAGALPSLLGALNAGSDQWAFALAAAAPGSPTFVAGTTDLATGGGYTQGGNNVSTVSASEVAGVMKLVLAAPARWTSSGGGFTFRYVLLVNKTNNIVPGYWDNGTNIALNGANGDFFDFTPDAVNGVFSET